MFTLRLAALVILALLVLQGGACKNPVDSPDLDEERILFIRGGHLSNEICTMKRDGSDIQVISRYEVGDGLSRGYYRSVKWSPDKKHIVLEGGPGSTHDSRAIWLLDVNGNFVKQLGWNGYRPLWISNSEILVHGWWTPDISLVDINAGKNSLYYTPQDSVGIRLTSISRDRERALGMLWEFTGIDSSGTYTYDTSVAIFELDALANYRRLLSRNNLSLSIMPRWAPDELQISYSLLDSNNVRNLYMMTAEGDSLYSLTDETDLNPMAYIHYTWSPDGRYLAYSRPSPGDGWNSFTDIYIHELETGIVTKITDTSADGWWYHPMGWK